MTVSMIGLSGSVSAIFTFIAFPMWGTFIDSLRKHREVFICVVLFISMATQFGKPWVVMVVAEHSNVVRCGPNGTLSNASRRYVENLPQTSHNSPQFPHNSPHASHNSPQSSPLSNDFGYNFSNRYFQYDHFICSSVVADVGAASAMPDFIRCMGTIAGETPGDGVIPEPVSGGIPNVGNKTWNPRGNCTTTKELSNPNVLFCAVTLYGLLASFFLLGVRTFTDSATIRTIYTRSTSYNIGKQVIF